MRAQQWARRLLLRHDGAGDWGWEAEQQGDCPFPPPGMDRAVDAVGGALDCDLGLSPLTNLMPGRRHRLLEPAPAAEIVVAWVSVPDLSVHAYRQRYEHVGAGDNQSTVRFTDLGLSPGFVADLVLDADGLVDVYPRLARRAA